MRIVLSILLVLFFTSLTPQVKKFEEQDSQPLELYESKIDYDSLAIEAQKTIEKIKEDKEDINYYKSVINKEEKKHKKLISEIKTELERKPEVIVVRDTICLMCNNNIE